MIFHHVYALIDINTNMIQDLQYFPSTDIAMQVAKMSGMMYATCCDDYDCQPGDYVVNARIYRRISEDEYIWIKPNTKYNQQPYVEDTYE